MTKKHTIIYIAAAIFSAALVHHFHALGGPYFETPQTIQDHVAKKPFPSRDAIVMCRRAALVIPRGATVTVILPSEAPNHDPTLAYTAVGLMPHHKIVLPKLEELKPQYVITVREPLNDPAYKLLTEYPEGNLYQRQ